MDSAEGDRQALADLFLSSGGQCWRNNQNWCTQASLKSWYGVTTDKDGRVVRLQLSANNLQGNISLIFYGDQISRQSHSEGIIPVTIGFLSKLSDLELSKNQLEGDFLMKSHDEFIHLNLFPCRTSSVLYRKHDCIEVSPFSR